VPDSRVLYTAEDCRFAADLRWGLTLFWRHAPVTPLPVESLATALAPDGIQLQAHRLVPPRMVQLTVGTLPQVAPQLIVGRVKGRLQHLIQDACPRAFQKNFALRSYGSVERQIVERYVATQLNHHIMAAGHIQERFEKYQIYRPSVDLSHPRYSHQGLYWCNLHLVFVHQQRWNVVNETVLQRVHDTILRVCDVHDFQLSRGGVLADHLHVTVGCPYERSPADVALCFLNNLAGAHSGKPVYQYGAYIGTFGEYDERSVAGQESMKEI